MFNLKAPYGLEKWGKPKYKPNLAKKNFIEITAYIRLVAEIPPEMDVWHIDRLSKLVNQFRKKKLQLLAFFLCLFFVVLITGFAIVASVLLGTNILASVSGVNGGVKTYQTAV